ncbi:MAG: putative quinol monooxygenase [Hyphomonadaceae bacterium]
MATNWLVVTLKVKDGMQAEFESIAGELIAQVRANEPGVATYTLTKTRTDPTEYIFIEHYLTPEARQEHAKTSYFRAIGARLFSCLVSPPTLVELDTIK